ncbi:MAG: sporulation transcriptional regulator SpoIIID [Clostridia bacterium]|nr:sporulation transcriptional regulator SpoIIID [Clostridia bacterium]
MNSYLCNDRPEKLAQYIIDNNSTVRACAKHFGISKSTVHKDLSERLAQINKSLYVSVKKVLDKNKSERHIRGGEATKVKYKYLKATQSRD